jgi:hypothetical protein
VGNFVRAGTRGLRVAVRANCPVCSVSCSTPPAVTESTSPLNRFRQCRNRLAVHKAAAVELVGEFALKGIR